MADETKTSYLDAQMDEFKADDGGHSDSTQDESLLQALSSNAWVIVYSGCMYVAPMLYGFDNVIVGVVTAMPAFK